MRNLIILCLLFVGCSKNRLLSPESKSPMENIMGKWYIHHESNPSLDRPDYWFLGFSPTGHILFQMPSTGIDSTTMTLTDTTFYYSTVRCVYTVVGDTLRFTKTYTGQKSIYLRFHGL